MSKAKTTKVRKRIIPKPNKVDKSKKKFPIPKEELRELAELKHKKIIFSFRFLELNHKVFNLGGTCANWTNDLFEMLKQLSNITKNDFVNKSRNHYRSHTHKWDELKYRYGFDDDFLEQVECRQARISSSKGGIHGFLVGNHFYVVWLDPHHNLYPDDKYGGVVIHNPPETCCGYRDKELECLNRENHDLKEEIEESYNMLDKATS